LVETICCFSAAAMMIGVRHRLQHELRETHDVNVEILDRAWLAEELADPEIFWIAPAANARDPVQPPLQVCGAHVRRASVRVFP
jgi:hypothetical protein